jgi:plasmid replication initiation protein
VNAKLVNSAAGVILAALQQNRTAAGIALALDSAQMLMTPETAAELERLRARVAELLAERHSTNEALADVTVAERSADKLTALFAPTQVLREELVAEAVTPRVQAMRALLDGQRAAVEDPHDGPLHHSYRVPRDLPEMGGR